MANIADDPKQWLFATKDTLTHADFTKLTVTLWAIWWSRRKVVHERIFQSPISTSHFINNFLADLDTVEVLKPIDKRKGTL